MQDVNACPLDEDEEEDNDDDDDENDDVDDDCVDRIAPLVLVTKIEGLRCR